MVGGAGEAHHHGKVAVVDFTGVDGQVVLRGQGHIVGRVLGRRAVGGGIDAEHREVAGVARPAPVVGVATELAHRRRRCTHQADILVDDVDKQEELVAIEHRFHLGGILGAFHGLFLNLGADLLNGSLAVALAHIVAQALFHLGGDILHAHKDRSRQARVGQLLVFRVGPETVAQVVVFHGRMLLQLAIATVVVGAHQALFRDNLTCAEMPEGSAGIAETHDGIFQAALVDAVDILGREFETGFLHVGIILANQRQKPHALVGACHIGQQRHQGHCDN